MYRLLTCLAAALTVLITDRCLTAQVTIQQPVVRAFTVNTTVSVPDRGASFVGGIKAAGDSRNSFGFGPFKPGSSVGTFREQASLSSSVWIHDFDAMDRALLETAESHRPDDGKRLSRSAQHAYRLLMARRDPRKNVNDRQVTYRRNAIGAMTPPAGTYDKSPSARNDRRTPSQPIAASDRAKRCYQLGFRAEQRGKPQLARLHYQVAAKHGSEPAQARLSQLLR